MEACNQCPNRDKIEEHEKRLQSVENFQTGTSIYIKEIKDAIKEIKDDMKDLREDLKKMSSGDITSTKVNPIIMELIKAVAMALTIIGALVGAAKLGG